MLENFSEVTVKLPLIKIIKQIRNLITSGQLAPGDRLPPERKRSERLGISRSYVKDAIRNLEFYGILKTSHQNCVEAIDLNHSPDIVHNFVALEVCSDDHYLKILEEPSYFPTHFDPDIRAAGKAMRLHLFDVMKLSQIKK